MMRKKVEVIRFERLSLCLFHTEDADKMSCTRLRCELGITVLYVEIKLYV